MPDHPDARPTSEQVRQAYEEGTRATAVALTLSAVLASLKVGAGILGNSYALVADGAESVLDIFTGLLVLGGLRLSAAGPTPAYPYGRGKAEPLAALVIATVLLLAAVGIAAGAVRAILTPHLAPAPFTLVVLVVVVLAKEGAYRWLVRRGRAIGSRAIEVDAWHHRADALTSLAAFIGISIALIGGNDLAEADDWAALVACGVIAWNGMRLFKGGLRELLDVTAPPEVHRRVRALAGTVPGVARVEALRVRRSGLVYLVDIHVEVDGAMSVRESHALAHRVKDRLLGSELPILDALVHVEPARAAEATLDVGSKAPDRPPP
ncbi:MAG TPA: cation diffusion facilitator family transporter [Longimicrobiales bacterium]|nr:cation diffusion facilitator family transporter [Longimicrobiales bacterium]